MQEGVNSKINWAKYKTKKIRFIALLSGWLPFGVLIGWPLPLLLGNFILTYILAAVYALGSLYSWLTYAFFPCPNCGQSLRGRQLYRSTCPNCGILINK
jgi:predicted RNA-binding Zn-ribbon protein involved in translation (DUF1610 family)